jgi:hypothetical protein
MIWPSLSEVSRRTLLRDAIALAASLRVAKIAHAAGEPFRVLEREQAAAIEALGDTILPGASVAGLAHFLDAQLAKPPDQALLTLRYVDVAPPYAAFYAAAAAALGIDFSSLGADERARIVAAMSSGGDLPDWSGPPPPLVYFVLRSDALDVLYGTISGFALLDIPYMPHIPPTEPW